ncbi:MAG: alpha/beta hydrolase [Eubacteriales bacterium]|nr:alpha/beta hydrolase [Eubacteriales bacterium]
MMEIKEAGINFKSIESQREYFEAYGESLKLITVPFEEEYVDTDYGKTYVIKTGSVGNPPLVLLHAASCGSPIWYKNLEALSETHRVYAIDLIGETSGSIMKRKLSDPVDNAAWLNQTLMGLKLKNTSICGLSIGGWNAANFASTFPEKVEKLILISPVQTFAKMYTSYFFKIMKMGFNPTRENVEAYIGWGSTKEAPLPDSIIRQFTLSVMNMNSNASFPRWLGSKQIANLKMPVMVLFGENEFAFDTKKAIKRAMKYVRNSHIEVVPQASHLIPVSRPEYTNSKILSFLRNEDI